MTGTLMLMSVHLVLVLVVVVVGVRVSRVMFRIVAGVVGVMSAGPVMFVSVHLVLVIMVVVVGVSVAFVMLLIVPRVVGGMRAVLGTMVVSVTMFVCMVFVFMPFMVVCVMAVIMSMVPVIVRERFAQLHVSLLVTPDDRGDQDHRYQQQLPNFGSLLEHPWPSLNVTADLCGRAYQRRPGSPVELEGAGCVASLAVFVAGDL